ncbi:helix-turn-helix domain-containing protein [Streptomyces sp. NBC_01591]|uniref:hypothetical protein n=1 Tax=Streptomyces sp. NBC_01591 TaxID=2975888 RepID=UPI002DDA5BEB|nr:hypothetical protein [Streptomyces sp. NBC_01591]WSD69418.1 helix-turn-helix domain-containing protein [Streptomyces sp. NBC_01591]
MLRHAIAPSARYTKASHDVVRHPRLSSDAKILLLYVQGLPGDAKCKPLGELARKLGIKGRAYQKAKGQLVEHGYVHEWRSQGEGGRWLTEQLVANNPLTSEQAGHLRGAPPTASPTALPATPPPSTQFPTVGEPAPRVVGGYNPVEDHSDKTTPHPPSEPEPTTVSTPEPTPQATTADPIQLARAERVLLSLRHTRRELHLGVREARDLAAEAVKWLERGLSESDLRHALLAERPQDGVRSAVGFLRYRLVQKLPEPPVQHQPQERPPLPELVECTGPGDPHVFRPLFGESECPSCRSAAAAAEPEPIPWRERIARINGTPAALPAEA